MALQPILDKEGRIIAACDQPVSIPKKNLIDHTDIDYTAHGKDKGDEGYESDESGKRMRQDVLPF